MRRIREITQHLFCVTPQCIHSTKIVKNGASSQKLDTSPYCVRNKPCHLSLWLQSPSKFHFWLKEHHTDTFQPKYLHSWWPYASPQKGGFVIITSFGTRVGVRSRVVNKNWKKRCYLSSSKLFSHLLFLEKWWGGAALYVPCHTEPFLV